MHPLQSWKGRSLGSAEAPEGSQTTSGRGPHSWLAAGGTSHLAAGL